MTASPAVNLHWLTRVFTHKLQAWGVEPRACRQKVFEELIGY